VSGCAEARRGRLRCCVRGVRTLSASSRLGTGSPSDSRGCAWLYYRLDVAAVALALDFVGGRFGRVLCIIFDGTWVMSGQNVHVHVHAHVTRPEPHSRLVQYAVVGQHRHNTTLGVGEPNPGRWEQALQASVPVPMKQKNKDPTLDRASPSSRSTICCARRVNLKGACRRPLSTSERGLHVREAYNSALGKRINKVYFIIQDYWMQDKIPRLGNLLGGRSVRVGVGVP
jgi:hypothetical protein